MIWRGRAELPVADNPKLKEIRLGSRFALKLTQKKFCSLAFPERLAQPTHLLHEPASSASSKGVLDVASEDPRLAAVALAASSCAVFCDSGTMGRLI